MSKVSVLLPLYNGERYIDDAVASVLQQSYRDFELLVLDDGSTDRSLELLKRHAARDPRLKIHARENRGLVATLNELLALATGDLIARMDADDVCEPDRFQRQVDFLAAHPEVVCVGGAIALIDDRGRLLTELSMPLRHDDIQQHALHGTTPVSHPAVMMRTDALRALGGYRAEFWPTEDLDLWLRLGEIGQVVNLPPPALLQYRLHSGSISGQHVARQLLAAQATCRSAWQRRGLPDMEFRSSDDWRPSSDPASLHRFALRLGWWAFNSGERATALVYGTKAIRLRPFAKDSWALFACSLVKPTPTRAPLRTS